MTDTGLWGTDYTVFVRLEFFTALNPISRGILDSVPRMRGGEVLRTPPPDMEKVLSIQALLADNF